MQTKKPTIYTISQRGLNQVFIELDSKLAHIASNKEDTQKYLDQSLALVQNQMDVSTETAAFIVRAVSFLIPSFVTPTNLLDVFREIEDHVMGNKYPLDTAKFWGADSFDRAVFKHGDNYYCVVSPLLPTDKRQAYKVLTDIVNKAHSGEITIYGKGNEPDSEPDCPVHKITLSLSPRSDNNEERESEYDYDPDDFDDVEMQRSNILPIGKAVTFDNLFQPKIMYIGKVDIPASGKPIYHLYTDPENFKKSTVSDIYIGNIITTTTDIYRIPPDENTYGFYVAPDYLDKSSVTAIAELALCQAIDQKSDELYSEFLRKTTVFQCHRCKRYISKIHPDDGDTFFCCGVSDDNPANMSDPEKCPNFWFDRWYGLPEEIKTI